jgi:ATP-dependent Clp protease ATP-binding subunit ClpB
VTSTTLPLTDRARRVVRDGDAERGRLGHPALTPQHVLWALLREEGSVAVLVLKDLHFDPAIVARCLGPEWHATGPAKPHEDPIAAAIESASELGDSYVDTAHLLLGLVRGQSRVGKFLRAEGVSYDAAAEATRRFRTSAVR